MDSHSEDGSSEDVLSMSAKSGHTCSLHTQAHTALSTAHGPLHAFLADTQDTHCGKAPSIHMDSSTAH